MNRIEMLARKFESFVALPWEPTVAPPQRIWFAVYDKEDERKLRARLGEFDLATRRAGHGWELIDLTTSFETWMAERSSRDDYFAEPQYFTKTACKNFRNHVEKLVRDKLTDPSVNDATLVAILGAACLFGFMRISELVNAIESEIRGRLLVFFPGEHEDNVYRLLDARDGWNYHAIPIKAQGGDADR
jgi:hypothetical protein